MRSGIRRHVILIAALLAATPAAAQPQPARIENARLETLPATPDLEGAFRMLVARRKEPAWVGYAVAGVEDRHICCHSDLDRLEESPCSGRCFLEKDHRSSSFVNSAGGCVEHDPESDVLVLLRTAGGEVGRIRFFSRDCTLDAGGLPVFWLTGVRPAESVAFLSTLVTGTGLELQKRRHPGEPALGAIAMHDDPSADAALEGFVAAEHPDPLRRKAAFWLGNVRGKRGHEVLRRLAREEPSEELRRHVTFALSQSRQAEAIETLIGMAKNDVSGRVRSQALFWLAQKAGRRVAGTIEEAVKLDPDTEVKKKAVFALTQLPNGEGIPHLIRVAQTNKNTEVRKKAIFWLGQSKDPRALQFIEETLLR